MKRILWILMLAAFGLVAALPQTAIAGHRSTQSEQAKHHKKHHKKGKKHKHHKKGHKKHKKHHHKQA